IKPNPYLCTKYLQMKNLFFIVVLFTTFTQAQVFTGKGDQKFQVGALIQDHGTGIIGTYDHGLGKNFSIGGVTSYLLGVEEVLGDKPNFEDRFDLKGRFSAHIADIFDIE